MSKPDEILTDLFSDSVFNVDSIYNKSSFNHIPMDTAIHRVDNGSALMAEISKIFQARLDVEDKEIGFSIRVSRPNLYELEVPSSTAEKALGYLKNYYLYVSREQASYRRNLDEDLLSELEESRVRRLNQVTEHKNNIAESTEEAAEASSNLVKAKQTYIKVLGDVEVVRQKLSAAVSTLHALKNMTEAQRKKKKEEENKYSMGRLFSAFERTPDEECKHQSKKLRKLEALASEKQQDIEEKKNILLEKIQKKESFYAQAAVAFEKAESERLFYTEKALRQYCSIEKQALEARMRLLTSFEEGAISQLDAQADVELFVSKSRNADNTRMYSNALKMMEWDFKARVETGCKPPSELDGSFTPGRLGSRSTGSGSGSVWADVEGDGSDKQTEMQSLHHDPDFTALEEEGSGGGGGEGGAEEHQAVEDEVTRILAAHFQEKPTLEYLFSQLKTKIPTDKTDEGVDGQSDKKDATTRKQRKHRKESEREGAAAVGMRKVGGTERSDTADNSTRDDQQGGSDHDDDDSSSAGGEEDDTDDDEADDGVTSEETRVLLSVSLLNETIFAGSTPASSSTAGGGGEQQESGTNAGDVQGERRVHCLSMVGFSMEKGRNAFLQILDDKRGRFATLDAVSFVYMTIAMKIFLDKCLAPRRVKCALRLANMSITFHKLLPIKASGDTGATGDNITSKQGEEQDQVGQLKHYVQREAAINQHELWHTAGFWEDALSHGLREQLVMMEPVQWDELEPELLNEKVMAIHNILFGQLGTLAFTMHEMGLEKTYVQGLVMNLGKSSQLGDDLLIDLFKSINISFGEDAGDDSDVSRTTSSESTAVPSHKVAPSTLEGGGKSDDTTSVTISAVKNEVMSEQGILDMSKESGVEGLL